MRLQVWILTAMLAALFTPLSTVLAIEADLNQPSQLESGVSTPAEDMVIFKPFLRVGDDITTGIEKTDALENTDEERARRLRIALKVPEGLRNTAVKAVQWSQTKLYGVIEKIAGPQAADKDLIKLAEFVYFPILYKRGAKPKDLLVKASLQTDPVKRAANEEAAWLFTAWIVKKHPN